MKQGRGRSRRWVYVKTGEPVGPRGDKRTPSVRAEVVACRTTYQVRMPDGEEREVTDDDLVFDRRDLDPISVAEVASPGRDPSKEYTHPSFGMVGIYHTSGHRPIHGSKLDSHQHYVTIRIVRGATEYHNLGRNWHYGGGDQIVEIALSSARFAELLSAPNRGDGVPCSIVYQSPMPGPGMIPVWPDRDTEAKRIVDRVRGLGREAAHRQAESRAAIEKLLEKIPKSRRDAVLAAFDDGARILNDTAPFLVESAVEALEHRVTESKAEVEAFVSTAIRSAGVAAIEADPSLLLLTAKDSEEGE